jgi:ribosomal protein S27AE
MTAETRYIADLADVLGLRIDCRKCGASLSRPPATAKEELPLSCPNCGTAWFVGENSDKNMAEALTRIVKHLATMPDQSWRVRLEFGFVSGQK